MPSHMHALRLALSLSPLHLSVSQAICRGILLLTAFIILLLDSSCGIQSCKVLYKADIFFGFATLNSALNPVIYTLRSKDMRKEFLRVLCCWGVLQSGRPSERCLVPLKSSSSLEHCTNKHEHQMTPIMQDCTTCV
ncbi:sphingosine 1-phosphate receptor 2 [Lates japonicus]|uniref:Sphingosine 1-phosphate receptor 2 n=1 Tax=Lates japonicus TaxID=270547 RepID=A0AAD3M7R1_LATJO|nr:sphingosine 1-phosphate receptor 2 [Lates japonicus]